jgi:glucosyl-3-phosphoglycerate synthase
MTDFHQEGVITTLHGLYTAFDRQTYLEDLELRLEEHSRHMKIGLLLPCLISDLENRQVLDRIMEAIGQVRYLHSVAVALGGVVEEARFQEALAYFRRLGTPERQVRVIWVDGPRIQNIFRQLESRDISTGLPGKGQSVWIALGYLFAREECDIIAMHDCDIVTYDRVLLGRLIEPTANPNNDFAFCKGYYARISPQERAMKGRVSRLFITPLVDTLRDIMVDHGHASLVRFFNFYRAFNYPLAGECSFLARMGRGINIAYDWGLEVATLSEVFHRLHPRNIAQIDLTENYEHKHQPLSPNNAAAGLHRMVADISRFFLFAVRSAGVPLDDAFVDMIRHSYYRNGMRFVKRYSDDADANGLVYDRFQEELTLRHFRDFFWNAWELNKGRIDGTLIPAWNRVLFSVPDMYPRLLEAVETDNA